MGLQYVSMVLILLEATISRIIGVYLHGVKVYENWIQAVMLNTSQLKIWNEQLDKLEILKYLHGIWKE